MLMIAQIRSADNRNMGSDRWLLAKIHRRDAEKNSEDSPRFLKKQYVIRTGQLITKKRVFWLSCFSVFRFSHHALRNHIFLLRTELQRSAGIAGVNQHTRRSGILPDCYGKRVVGNNDRCFLRYCPVFLFSRLP